MNPTTSGSNHALKTYMFYMSTDLTLWTNEMTPDFHMHECHYSCLNKIRIKTKNSNKYFGSTTKTTIYG